MSWPGCRRTVWWWAPSQYFLSLLFNQCSLPQFTCSWWGTCDQLTLCLEKRKVNIRHFTGLCGADFHHSCSRIITNGHTCLNEKWSSASLRWREFKSGWGAHICFNGGLLKRTRWASQCWVLHHQVERYKTIKMATFLKGFQRFSSHAFTQPALFSFLSSLNRCKTRLHSIILHY